MVAEIPLKGLSKFSVPLLSAIKTKDGVIWLCEHHCYKQDEQFAADLAAALQVKAFKEVAPKKFRRIVLHSKALAESSSAVKG